MYCKSPTCPLHSCPQLRSHGIAPSGSDSPLLYIVGEAPGGTEDREGIQFVGAAGKFLRDVLRRSDIDSSKVRFNNAVRCGPWNEKKGGIGTPTAAHIRHCLPSVLEDIENTNPRVIVTLGNIPTQAITNQNAGITTIRGSLHEVVIGDKTFMCIPTLHPSGILRSGHDATQIQFFMTDLAKAWQLATGTAKPNTSMYEGRDYGILSTLDEVQCYVDHCVKLCRADPNHYITADFEAGALEAWRGTNPMLGLGISYGPYQGRYIPMEHWQSPFNGQIRELAEILRPLADVPMANQNIGFDYLWWKWRLGIELKQELIRHDPLLGHHSIFSGTRPNDLETLGGLYLMEPAWSYKLSHIVKAQEKYFKQQISARKKECKKLKLSADADQTIAYWKQWVDLAKMGVGYSVVPCQDLATYCCIDVDVTWRLVPVIERMLTERGLYQAYRENYHDHIKTFAEMQYDGIAVDNNVVSELRQELPGEMDAIQTELRMTKEVQQTVALKGKGEFKMGSPKDIASLLYDVMRCSPARIPGKSPRTTEDGQLQQLIGKYKREKKEAKVEILEKIASWRSLDKLHGTYVMSNVKYQDSSGLVHPSWKLQGTRTGRIACDSPPVHSSPTSHGLRRQYFSRWHDIGGILLGADESQIELRLFASLAEDQTLINFYNNMPGADLHRFMASLLFDVPYEAVTKEQRRIAKTCVFASLYGGGAGNLASQTGMDMPAAKRVHGKFLELVSIKQYSAKREVELTRFGGVHSVFGHFLRIDVPNTKWGMAHAMRQALNSPIQVAASMTVQRAIIRARRYMQDAGLKSKIIIFHHDAIYWDVYPGELFQVLAIAQHVLVTEPQQIYTSWLRVPLKVGIEFGNSWGDKIEVDSFTQDSLTIDFQAEQDEECCYERYQKEVAWQFEGPMGQILQLENLKVDPQEIAARVTSRSA